MWGISEDTLEKQSFTPLRLPGKFKISVFSRLPATILDKHAYSVVFSPSVIIFITSPGASFWIICLVASGVLSRLEKPVPPVVKMTSQDSQSSNKALLIVSKSSGIILYSASFK